MKKQFAMSILFILGMAHMTNALAWHWVSYSGSGCTSKGLVSPCEIYTPDINKKTGKLEVMVRGEVNQPKEGDVRGTPLPKNSTKK